MITASEARTKTMISAEEARKRLVKHDEAAAEAWLKKADEAIEKAVLQNRRNVDLPDVTTEVYAIITKALKDLGYEVKKTSGSGCGSSDYVRIIW